MQILLVKSQPKIIMITKIQFPLNTLEVIKRYTNRQLAKKIKKLTAWTVRKLFKLLYVKFNKMLTHCWSTRVLALYPAVLITLVLLLHCYTCITLVLSLHYHYITITLYQYYHDSISTSYKYLYHCTLLTLH